MNASEASIVAFCEPWILTTEQIAIDHNHLEHDSSNRINVKYFTMQYVCYVELLTAWETIPCCAAGMSNPVSLQMAA